MQRGRYRDRNTGVPEFIPGVSPIRIVSVIERVVVIHRAAGVEHLGVKRNDDAVLFAAVRKRHVFDMRREHAQLAVLRVGIEAAVVQVKITVVAEAASHVLDVRPVKAGNAVGLPAAGMILRRARAIAGAHVINPGPGTIAVHVHFME